MPCNLKNLSICLRKRRNREKELLNALCVGTDSVEDNSVYLLLQQLDYHSNCPVKTDF